MKTDASIRHNEEWSVMDRKLRRDRPLFGRLPFNAAAGRDHDKRDRVSSF
jgi:hypothetical protein